MESRTALLCSRACRRTHTIHALLRGRAVCLQAVVDLGLTEHPGVVRITLAVELSHLVAAPPIPAAGHSRALIDVDLAVASQVPLIAGAVPSVHTPPPPTASDSVAGV